MKATEYALYKGEELLYIGTAKELVKKLNIKRDSLMYYGTNSYKKRLSKRKNSRNSRILVALDDKDD